MVAPLTAGQTLDLVARTRHVLARTRSLIGLNRLRLNPWWGVSGGSEDGDRERALLRSIRSRLARGILIPAPNQVWAGHGTGKPCVICLQKIDADEIENETSVLAGGVDVKLWAHLACFNVWRLASQFLEDERSSRERVDPGVERPHQERSTPRMTAVEFSERAKVRQVRATVEVALQLEGLDWMLEIQHTSDGYALRFLKGSRVFERSGLDESVLKGSSSKVWHRLIQEARRVLEAA